jgi:hypothetical protein
MEVSYIQIGKLLTNGLLFLLKPVSFIIRKVGKGIEIDCWSAGDILFFGSHLAHRSGPNRTDKNRAMVYATYACEADGKDLRAKYYEHRRATFPPDHGMLSNNCGHIISLIESRERARNGHGLEEIWVCGSLCGCEARCGCLIDFIERQTLLKHLMFC